VLPQVLAGLGVLGLFSAGCLFWLEKLAPLFFVVAVGSLAYQIWIVRRRPPSMRTAAVKAILGVSLALNGLVIGTWVLLWFRYR
jgi:hypothetical protein